MSGSSTSAGLFVTFEGIDGSGKSTQIARCAETLRQAGHEVVLTRNPGGTELGQEIRQLLLHHPGFVSPTCELMLYMADRAQHLEEVVLPSLQAGQVILCDRYVDSTLAYQGYGRGLDLDRIWELNRIATQGRNPDLTLLFDGPPEILAERVSNRGVEDRLEREAMTFRQKVRDGYLALASQDSERVKVLNALETVDDLHHQVMAILNDRLAGCNTLC